MQTSIDMVERSSCLVCGSDMLVEKPFHEMGLCWHCAHTVAAAYVEAVTGEPDRRLDYEGYQRYRASRGKPVYVKTVIPEPLRWVVFKRDGYRCVNCGGDTHLRADHIHPERKGGTTTLDNLQTLCARCNSRKGTR